MRKSRFSEEQIISILREHQGFPSIRSCASQGCRSISLTFCQHSRCDSRKLVRHRDARHVCMRPFPEPVYPKRERRCPILHQTQDRSRTVNQSQEPRYPSECSFFSTITRNNSCVSVGRQFIPLAQ